VAGVDSIVDFATQPFTATWVPGLIFFKNFLTDFGCKSLFFEFVFELISILTPATSEESGTLSGNRMMENVSPVRIGSALQMPLTEIISPSSGTGTTPSTNCSTVMHSSALKSSTLERITLKKS
jgi:hypothetical protein